MNNQLTAGPDSSGTVAGAPPPAARPARLGEELPIFCERCGYSLNGLTQVRCEQCDVLQFHCPECGHHQPINTLRPAVQRILARLRAWVIGFVLLFKLNYFGWLLFAWVVAGYEMSYSWWSQGGGGMNWTSNVQPYPVRLEDLVAMGLLGLFFGLVGRMLVLRWGNGGLVGLVLGALVGLALLGGARWHYAELDNAVPPWTANFLGMVGITALMTALGAGIAWWIWSACAYLFLPRKTAGALLDWQRSRSTPRATGLARE